MPHAPPLPPGSVLERGADLLHGELTDAYGLTHAVLHATDTGLAAPHSSRPAPAVAADAEALLGAALAAGNLDVAAELPVDLADARTAAQPRCAVRPRRGRPGRGHPRLPPRSRARPPLAAALAPAERSTYVVQTSYHTAVVAGILAAALLRRGAPASDRASGTPTDPAADPLPLLRLADGPWADRLRNAAPSVRVACTPLVLGAELRTAAGHRDPARVHEVVAWAAEHGWAHLPSVRQGAALLTRVARAAAQPLTVAC